MTPRDIPFRREMLRLYEEGLRKWEKPLCDALWTDLHKSYEEAYMTEIGLIYGEIRDARRHVARWARTRRVRTPLTGMPSSSYVVREPLGHVLIVSPWNYPVQLLLNPLVGAIAAGCTAVLKPSPYVPNVSQTLADFIADTFPADYVTVVQGNRTVNAELFARRWDMVFFTGSPALGKVVMEAQSKYLTPLVLELGGKSPCFVTADADVKLAAKRLAWGKALNAGQTCIAPDYVLIDKRIRDAFVDEYFRQVHALLGEVRLTTSLPSDGFPKKYSARGFSRPFTKATASSSVSYEHTGRTGPKISFVITAESGAGSSATVGSM